MWSWKKPRRRDQGPSWGGPVPSGPVTFHPLLRTAQALLEAASAGETAKVPAPTDERRGPVATPPQAA